MSEFASIVFEKGKGIFYNSLSIAPTSVLDMVKEYFYTV